MWGSNPFTNYTGGPQSFSMGGGGYGNPSMNGQFNPGALDFSSGSMGGGSQGWGTGYGQFNGGGMLGASPWQGQSQGQSQGMPPWMNQSQSPWQGGSMFGGGMGQSMQMPPWMRGGMGMNPASRGMNRFGGGMNYQTMPYAQPTQAVPAQAADPNGMNGVYGNVVHNGSFDSAGAQLNPLLRSMIQS